MFKYRVMIGGSSNKLLTMLTKKNKCIRELRMPTLWLVAASTSLPVVMALKRK